VDGSSKNQNHVHATAWQARHFPRQDLSGGSREYNHYNVFFVFFVGASLFLLILF
jgi:hypothetical protein